MKLVFCVESLSAFENVIPTLYAVLLDGVDICDDVTKTEEVIKDFFRELRSDTSMNRAVG
mgnify:CR=1 FL=1